MIFKKISICEFSLLIHWLLQKKGHKTKSAFLINVSHNLENLRGIFLHVFIFYLGTYLL